MSKLMVCVWERRIEEPVSTATFEMQAIGLIDPLCRYASDLSFGILLVEGAMPTYPWY